MIKFLNGIIIFFYFYAFILADKRDLFLHYHLNFVPGDFATDSRYPMFALVVVAILWIILWIAVKIKKQKEINLKVNDFLVVIPVSGIIMLFSSPKISFKWVLLSMLFLIMALFLTIKTINIFLKTKKAWKKFLPIVFVSTPFLILFHSVEMVGKIKTPASVVYIIAGLTLLFSFLGNLFISFLYKKKEIDLNYLDIFWVTLTVAYLFLPLFHFVFMTPMSTKYITNMDNFLAKNCFLQTLIIGIHYILINICFVKINNNYRDRNGHDRHGQQKYERKNYPN